MKEGTVIVYVLQSESDQKHYTGMTKDINRRLLEHNSGRNRFTKGHIPWRVIYTEEFNNYEEGRKRENYLKTGSGRRWLKEKLSNG